MKKNKLTIGVVTKMLMFHYNVDVSRFASYSDKRKEGRRIKLQGRVLPDSIIAGLEGDLKAEFPELNIGVYRYMNGLVIHFKEKALVPTLTKAPVSYGNFIDNMLDSIFPVAPTPKTLDEQVAEAKKLLGVQCYYSDGIKDRNFTPSNVSITCATDKLSKSQLTTEYLKTHEFCVYLTENCSQVPYTLAKKVDMAAYCNGKAAFSVYKDRVVFESGEAHWQLSNADIQKIQKIQNEL